MGATYIHNNLLHLLVLIQVVIKSSLGTNSTEFYSSEEEK